MLDILLDHLGKGLYYMLLISMPIVLVAAGIGLVVGILQAVTQVQEQTIAAAPKILGVFLVILIGGGLILKLLNDYTSEALIMATETIPKEHSNSAPPKDYTNGKQSRFEFFNDLKFVRKKENPNFKEMMDKPLNSPYMKNKQPKEPNVYSPAPPLPNANISEEIKNFKNMKNSSQELRTIPPIEQKAPVVPPISRTKPNPKISLLPSLDEPPAVNPSELKSNVKIAANSNNNTGVTGAAAIIDSSSNNKVDSKPRGSTIIINNNTNKSSENLVNKATVASSIKRGAIILEAE